MLVCGDRMPAVKTTEKEEYKNTPSFIADQATTSRGDIMPHGRRAYSSLKRQFGYMSIQRISTCPYIIGRGIKNCKNVK